MTTTTVIVKRSTIEERYPGGLDKYCADATTESAADGDSIAVRFDDPLHADRWIEHLGAAGVARDEVVLEHGDHTHSSRFDILSRSSSGLHYVRERRGGLMRVLTESEIADFDDPAPCPECAEQFGCEHFNCAGEPLLSEAEIASDVPRDWLALAKDYGISREDLRRLQQVECFEGEWRLKGGVKSDVRMLELMLLLNDAR